MYKQKSSKTGRFLHPKEDKGGLQSTGKYLSCLKNYPQVQHQLRNTLNVSAQNNTPDYLNDFVCPMRLRLRAKSSWLTNSNYGQDGCSHVRPDPDTQIRQKHSNQMISLSCFEFSLWTFTSHTAPWSSLNLSCFWVMPDLWYLRLLVAQINSVTFNSLKVFVLMAGTTTASPTVALISRVSGRPQCFLLCDFAPTSHPIPE